MGVTHQFSCSAGISAAGFSITTELAPEQQAGWRRLGEHLLRLLDAQGTGLAITLDEIHGADRDELAQLAAAVQHFIRDGLPIALVFADRPVIERASRVLTAAGISI
ncbi:hypothetical protein [[Micrococcus luteus] ATCC 49442]|uniref:hypothetical protein n=1 Tax=[Micrococcus luteus] ATCC 49442 TaxID=2698727 RepID=UPI001FCB47F6|nr:hypothetical protein [[Micrococcus luteus] ATCC 49442]